MEFYAKGQLSFLILTCLLERDFYGLDFISEIYNKSNGRIELKKPSVYSNLTRMEKQGYVSSYLKSSDVGPNRKYYSITEKGRGFYKELQEYFARNKIDVFRDFQDEEDVNNKSVNLKTSIFENKDYTQASIEEDEENNEEINSYIEEEADSDYFDFSNLSNDQSDKKQDNKSEVIEKSETREIVSSSNGSPAPSTIMSESFEGKNIQVQEEKYDKTTVDSGNNTYSIRSLLSNKNNDENAFDKSLIESNENSNVAEDTSSNKQQEEKKDDGVFLSDKTIEEYNKRLYDISKDINKYKRKRSFAEDQMSFTVESPLAESNERTKANIEEFKSSILENKGKISTENNNYDFAKQMSYRYRNNANVREDTSPIQNNYYQKPTINIQNESTPQDDGKFITNRIEVSQIERAKKIEPPRLKIVPETSSRDSYKMPPPKRDVNIDPSHKEILSKLYSKTKNSDAMDIREDALYDYGDLQEFYKDQNIEFSVYKKPAEKNEHNTNKLYLIVSLITFFVASAMSAILYTILYNTSLLNSSTTFLYILLPALLLIDIAWKFYNYKKYLGWLPSQMLPQWKIWAITFLLIGCVVGLNFIFGLAPSTFAQFATTTLLPIVIIFVVMPLRYYVKRYLLIKYWK